MCIRDSIKACPSLPTAPYQAGNVRDTSVEDLWEHAEQMAFTRNRTKDELWGFCSTCEYGDTCRAGCSFTAHCTLGRRGNMPFCYHRAKTLESQGLREVLVHKEKPAGNPYDFGRFDVVTEPIPS